MTGTATTASRPLRADAQRNRDALVAQATIAFTSEGVDASLEDVARQAGVGIGTLYRNFPTREALIEAVYRSQVEQLCDAVPALLADREPVEALTMWMQRFVAHVARKRGMAVALKAACGPDRSDLFAYARGRMTDALQSLLQAGIAAGVIRADVDPNDLMRALSGICMVTDNPGWQEQAARLVTLLVDGLRYGAGVPVTAAS